MILLLLFPCSFPPDKPSVQQSFNFVMFTFKPGMRPDIIEYLKSIPYFLTSKKKKSYKEKKKTKKNAERLPKTLVWASLIELCLCLQASGCPLGETSSPWIRLDSASASTLDWNQKHHQAYSKRTESYSRGWGESPTGRLGKVESTLVVLVLFCFYLIFDWPSYMAFKISVPWPGIEPNPQKWKSRILTTRSLGNF